MAAAEAAAARQEEEPEVEPQPAEEDVIEEVDEREAEPMKPPGRDAAGAAAPPQNRYQFKKKAKPAGLSLDGARDDGTSREEDDDEVTRKDGGRAASLEQL